VIVHSFSRFFRDHFDLEFYVRKAGEERRPARRVEAADKEVRIMDRKATCSEPSPPCHA
jgi:hypothetical protein